ncbi:MAG: hypothetical protein EXS36_16485 [Pedosphaera sp.]|nr:hypothetical protein [Pedosphaera sp.]
MHRLLLVPLVLGVGSALLGAETSAVAPEPPPLNREFRGVWVASVVNINWPSKAGLPVAQQQAELRGILQRAHDLRFNAVLIQVRPACDALYPSSLEPWSEYLTGRMGKAPEPLWDPLKMAVSEAHALGLELHAWFNPFRARFRSGLGPASPDHISVRKPQFVHQMGLHLWLDPGESDVREHVSHVILDVVRRYDIDGVHLDDYFYPYPEPGSQLTFPDDRSWNRYQRSGGRLSRDDWRRYNVDTFVQSLGRSIHQEKPWVRFGISPFGIWRPGNPASIKGMDAYQVLYADSRKWIREGWLDYIAPQLYWPIQSREQSFPSLLRWWADQNPARHRIFAGMDATRIGQDRNAGEILAQIGLTRKMAGVDGIVLWNCRVLRENRGGLGDLLTRQAFTSPALPPSFPWLSTNPPPAPALSVGGDEDGTRLQVTWKTAENAAIRWYVLRSRVSGRWQTEFLSSTRNNRVFERMPGQPLPVEIRLVPIDLAGVESEAAVWVRAHRRPLP